MFNLRKKCNSIMVKRLFILFFICSVFISCLNKDKKENEITEPTTTTTTTTSTTIAVSDVEIEEPMPKELGEIILERFVAVEDAVYKKDFNTWYKYISNGYKSFLNNKEELMTLSNERVYLVNKKIVLKTPEDYFRHIVVASRSGRAVIFDKFTKIGEKKVKVYCHMENMDYTYTYYYVFEDGEWKLER